MNRSISYVFFALLTLNSAVGTAQPQATPVPYSSSPLIQGETLDPERAKIISQFLALPLKSQKSTALGTTVCKPTITKPTPSPELLTVALALVEADLVPILSFQRPAVEGKPAASISYSIELDLDTVTLRSTNPRYQSQSGGLKVAYPDDTTRPVWFEGKDEVSILFLVPPVRDCNIQFVVACPRTYSKSRTLDESKLALAGVRYVPAIKADGLFKTTSEEAGKVFAGALATSRVQLPSPWSSENTSHETPSASFKVRKPFDTLASEGSFTPVTLPIVDGVEARLELGTTSSVKRVVRSRATVELSTLTMDKSQSVLVERAEVLLNPGSCIVISRRKETHY